MLPLLVSSQQVCKELQSGKKMRGGQTAAGFSKVDHIAFLLPVSSIARVVKQKAEWVELQDNQSRGFTRYPALSSSHVIDKRCEAPILLIKKVHSLFKASNSTLQLKLNLT